MTAGHKIRQQRLLKEAEGYLELELPQQALSALARMKEPGTFKGHQLYLVGESLRAMEQYQAAIIPLEQAADLMPSNTSVAIALGWCYKRTDQLARAISVLERAKEVEPKQAVLHYNLACYYSLAGEKVRALRYLARALAMEPHYRLALSQERDFDAIRSDPEFQVLTAIIV